MGTTWIVFAVIEFAVLGVFTYKLLNYYSTKSTPWIAWLSVFISWYLGFFGTLFLPIDIAEAYTSQYMNVTYIVEEPAANVSMAAGGWRLLQAGNSSGNGSGNGSTPDSTYEVISDEVIIRNGPLESMWQAVYWMTFMLTYIVLPLVQEYVAAGDFTRMDRFITSLRVNGVFYLAIGVVGIIALGVVLGSGWGIMELFPILISLANTYGLALIVLLMGYGTAEVPRAIWAKSFPEQELRKLQFQACEVEANVFDARSELNDVISQVKALQAVINALGTDPEVASGEGAREYAELQRCMAIVLAKCTVDVAVSSIAASRASSEDDAAAAKAAKKGWRKSKLNMSKLAGLHKRLMALKAKVAKQRFRWERHVLRAIELEYVLSRTPPPLPVMQSVRRQRGGSLFGAPDAESAQPDDLQLVTASALSALSYLPNMCGGAPNRLLWQFKIRFAPLTYRIIAALAEVMSLLLLWSEATIWVNLQGLTKNNLSVFGLLLFAADMTGGHAYASIQVAASIPLIYMCIASAYALFKLKLFDMLDLSGNRNTDPYSLCFNATLFNRLQFSLAFNYLNVLMHSTDKTDYPDTAFMHSVGAKMKLSVIDWYLPLIMVLIYILTRLNIFEWGMRMVGYDEKGSPVKGNVEHDKLIADGAKLIARTKNTLGLDGGVIAAHVEPLSDRVRGVGRAAMDANPRAHVEMAAVRGAAGTPTYEPPPAARGDRSGFMSLNAFASRPTPSPAPAPAPASSFSSWSFDDNDVGNSSGGGGNSSSAMRTRNGGTPAAPVARAPAPAPAFSSFGHSSSTAARAAAPAPSSYTSTSGSSVSAAAAAAFSVSAPPAPAAPSGAGGGGGLAALLRGKRGAGYGQLD